MLELKSNGHESLCDFASQAKVPSTLERKSNGYERASDTGINRAGFWHTKQKCLLMQTPPIIKVDC
ncbi:MAG: hypothetical protein SOZ59_06385 [Candidatus Limivivens sp.]|nr:hypothetical protein [Candidatus Limivivens sp.]